MIPSRLSQSRSRLAALTSQAGDILPRGFASRSFQPDEPHRDRLAGESSRPDSSNANAEPSAPATCTRTTSEASASFLPDKEADSQRGNSGFYVAETLTPFSARGVLGSNPAGGVPLTSTSTQLLGRSITTDVTPGVMGSTPGSYTSLREFQKLVDLSRALQDKTGTVNSDHDVLPISTAQELFQKLTTAELANALLNLELASNEAVVDAATAILTSRRVMSWSTLSAPLLWAVKRTAHAHFCAGETIEEASQTLQRMWDLGLKGILDFSVEDALDDATCDRNLEGFLRTIRYTKSMPAQSVSYACVKLTALCPLPVLEKASAQIRLHHMHPSKHPAPSWMLPSLPVLADVSPPLAESELSSATSAELSPDEVRTWEATYERLRKICEACEEQGVPLLIDAEYQSVEPAIDHLAYAAAVEFNRPGNSPLIYATIQCYLKDALPRLQRSFDEAQKRGIPFGAKLVRGAYLTRETELAKSLGVPSPVFDKIEDTHECYDTCAALMIGAAAQGGKESGRNQAGVVLATHNYGSGRKAVMCAHEAGLDRKDPRLQFAQLKGMADGLSLTLALSGFNVSKYLPYGKVEEVMPYLLRRAQENRGVLGNTRDERVRIWSELKRRLLSPVGLSRSQD